MKELPRSYDDDTQYDESQVQAMIEKAVREEREACATVCDDWPLGRDDVHSIATAIRSRGNP